MKSTIRGIMLMIIGVLIANCLYPQGSVKGIILNAKTGKPVPYASVGIVKRNSGAISDTSGIFLLELTKNLNHTDTIVISSIGYKDKMILLQEFLSSPICYLDPTTVELGEVKVYSFKNEKIIGSFSERRNLNSGWSGPGSGGEIGNLIEVGAALFRLESVSFYMYTGCDTTVFRLHVREFVDGHPGEELLSGNILFVVTKQEGISQHDLSKFNIIITDNPKIFIGLELIGRSQSVASPKIGSNVHITGHKGGMLHYKWYPQTPWQINKDYELSLRIKAKY